MGIYIKGMKMPTDCEECRFCIGLADTEYGTCAGCLIDNEYREASSKSGCPLIEIPEPHGDLIDRDAFRADFSMGENCNNCGIELKRCEYDRIYTKMDFCGWLDDAPTVIPREDGETNADAQ